MYIYIRQQHLYVYVFACVFVVGLKDAWKMQHALWLLPSKTGKFIDFSLGFPAIPHFFFLVNALIEAKKIFFFIFQKEIPLATTLKKKKKKKLLICIE